MTAATLRALKGSIRKWEKIEAGTGVDRGPDNCQLCKLFWKLPSYCASCPVMEKTEQGTCCGSPYDAWIRHYWDEHEDDHKTIKVYCPTCRKLAHAEVVFLKSLLPKKEATDEKMES